MVAFVEARVRGPEDLHERIELVDEQGGHVGAHRFDLVSGLDALPQSTGGGLRRGALFLLPHRLPLRIVAADITQHIPDLETETAMKITEARDGAGENESREQRSVQQVVDALDWHDGTYRRAEVDEVLRRPDEFIPELLTIVADVLADPEGFLAEDDYIGHVYAVMLLGHLRVSEAHAPIIELFCLPGDLPHVLFDDIITEDLPHILLRTCNGSLDAIKALAQNAEADAFVRASGVMALTHAVCEGLANREETLGFLEGFLDEAVAWDDVEFTTMAAASICDLCPAESMEKIAAGFELGFIDPGFMEWEWYEQSAAAGPEECLATLREKMEQNQLDDVHTAMSGWACFNEEPELSYYKLPDRVLSRKQSKKKSKRKSSAASRKKNRR